MGQIWGAIRNLVWDNVKFEMSFQHVTGDIDLGVSNERVVSLIKKSKKRVL